MPRRGRRGYPTAILIGLDSQSANIWLVYSESIKSGKVFMKSADDKTVYRHNEEIVEAIRGLIPDGFNQLIIASPEKTHLASNLVEHINRSHGWLIKRLAVKELQGKAVTAADVVQLIKSNRIQESVAEAVVESIEKIMERLEKALNTGDVLFTLEELSHALRGKATPEFILVTEKFDVAWRGDRRYQSMIHRAKNMSANFTIVKHETPASARIEQLGGFVSVIRR
jgi:stalled ribosome rescue protein Dom34